MRQRSALVDGLKVLASHLIVLHHIVLYAPMADRVAPAWPWTRDFLLDEARFVVQLFLVIGGFLAAQGLSRPPPSLPRALLARYLRLVPMLAVALLAVLAASALLPADRWPDWVTPWPTLGQFLAHLLLLQDILGIPSLSAGAWYVAIDFQLFALLAIGSAVLLRDAPSVERSALPWVVAALTLTSLLWFSRNPALDVWGLYFFGSYGLGALAAWRGRSRALGYLFVGVCVLLFVEAWVQVRPRVALACLCAIALASQGARGSSGGRSPRLLAYWSDASYGVFLIHYAVIVAVSAMWLRLDLGSRPEAWGLLLICWAASLAAGAALQRGVGEPLARLAWMAATPARLR